MYHGINIDVLELWYHIYLFQTELDSSGPRVSKGMLLTHLSRNPNSLQWRHNDRDGVSNYWRLDYLLKNMFRRKSKKTSKPRFTGLCEGNSLVTGEYPAQRASNAEHVSIWWRHHVPTGLDCRANYANATAADDPIPFITMSSSAM